VALNDTMGGCEVISDWSDISGSGEPPQDVRKIERKNKNINFIIILEM
jgi:hypothetical protein